MGVKRLLVPVVALLVVTGLVLGLVSGVFGTIAHRGLVAAGLETSAASGAASSGALGPSATGTGRTRGGSTAPSATPSSGSAGSVVLPAPVLAGTDGQGAVSAAAVSDLVRTRGEVPFLHTSAANTRAIDLYLAMGFELRRTVEFASYRAL